MYHCGSGDLSRTLPIDDQCMAIDFSPDGKLLAAGCFNSQIYIWGIEKDYKTE